MKALPIEKWHSFVPDGNLDTIRKSVATATTKTTLPPTIRAAHVQQSQVKATSDATFNLMNQAAVNMVRNASVDPEPVIESLEKRHQHDLQVKATIKHEKKVAKKRHTVPEAAAPAAPPAAAAAKKQKTVEVPPVRTIDELPVETLEQHNKRDDQLSLFTSNMQRISKPVNDIVINAPPTTEVLAYCAKFKQEFPWFTSMQNLVTSSDTYEYPDTPVMRRSYLMNYLFEPDPSKLWQRPCFNLDREAHPHEMRARCIAHRMTEQHYGPGKGFRLRELLMVDTQTKVEHAVQHKRDPSVHLGPIPELCYLCHLWISLRDSTHQRDKADERARKDMTDDTNPAVTIINKFMVYVDQAGEYDRNKVLTSDKVSMGIWGPCPIFNECNYVHTTKLGLRGFEETDNLLFHPAQAQLHQRNTSGSSRSSHTAASSQATGSSRP